MSRNFLRASQRAAGSLREVAVPLCCTGRKWIGPGGFGGSGSQLMTDG